MIFSDDSLLGLDWLLLWRLLPCWQKLQQPKNYPGEYWSMPSNMKLKWYIASTDSLFDVEVCEDMETIDTLHNVTVRFVNENYIDQQVPVIITDSLADWPVASDDYSQQIWKVDFCEVWYTIWTSNMLWFLQAYEEKWDIGLGVCHLTSNLRLRNGDLMQLFHYIDHRSSWFAHWSAYPRLKL